MPTNRSCALVALLLAVAPDGALAQDAPPPTARLVDSTTSMIVAPMRSDGVPQKTFFTSRDLIATGAAAAVTVGVMQFDKKIARWTQQPNVQGSSSRNHFVGQITRINETPLTIGAILTYGVGRLTHSQTTADVGLHWSEALLLTDVISEAIRGPVGRTRPRVTPDDPFKFQFGKGFTNFDNRAFPSLHSAVGFATAAALLGEIRQRHPEATWYAAPLLYAFALVPGTTRIYLNQHWASDVVAGAFIGQLIGARVVHYAHTHNPTKLDRVLLATAVSPNGYGGKLIVVSASQLFGSSR